MSCKVLSAQVYWSKLNNSVASPLATVTFPLIIICLTLKPSGRTDVQLLLISPADIVTV